MIVTDDSQREVLLSAGARLRFVLDSVAERIVPGASPSDLDVFAQELIEAEGDVPAFLGYRPSGTSSAFPAALCVSVNDAIVHGVPDSATTILDGDVVSIDCGLQREKYFVDAACTVIAGDGDSSSRRLVEATRKALQCALVVTRAGMRIGDIGNAIETVASEHDFITPPELGGHGIGLSPHEEPFIPNMGDSGQGETLSSGQVIALEPILLDSRDPRVVLSEKDGFTYRTADGGRSAHFEHTLIVTDGAPILVTGPMW